MNDGSVGGRRHHHSQRGCVGLIFTSAAQSPSPYVGQEIASGRSNFTLQLAQDSQTLGYSLSLFSSLFGVSMFTLSAHLYDAVYLNRGKNYAAEAESVHQFIQHNLRSGGDTLLDVACGTGMHTSYLRYYYEVEGLDLDARMLEAAKDKCPELTFHLGDMRDFDLGRQFDVITCLFSSIGYVGTVAGLNQAIANFDRHLKPGGLIFIEPWFTPEDWHPGKLHATFVDEPRLKISRMNLSGQDGNLSYIVFHYLVGTPEGIEYFTERHELGLFTVDEYLSAFRACGLDVERDALWLNGRGLYMASKPLEK